jgi:hypothetical protein
MFESFFAKIAGKFAAKKLDLQGDEKMDESKKWYQSKGVWTGVVTALLGAYVTLAPVFKLPAIPEWIFTFLGAMGIYSRISADTKIQ